MARKEAPPPPADADVRELLRGAWGAYRALLDGQPDLRPEWKYYGQKYGWSLKLFAGSRNLCFIGTYAGEFKVGIIFGERDVQRVLASDIAQTLKDELAAARQYVEGRALSLLVREERDLEPVLQLLAIKRTTPKAGAAAPKPEVKDG